MNIRKDGKITLKDVCFSKDCVIFAHVFKIFKVRNTLHPKRDK